MTSGRILIVEDDLDVATLVAQTLSEAGFDVSLAHDGVHALLSAREEAPDLIVLDLGLPDFSGEDIVTRLRTSSQVPIVVLSAHCDTNVKVRLLERGANDYVVKPFYEEELLARVKRVLRKTHDEVVRLGPLSLTVAARRACVHDAELSLTPREFDLLLLLARTPGRVYTREEIQSRLWDKPLPKYSNVVDVHVSNIRLKMAEAGAPTMLRTVRGLGYGLSAPRDDALRA